MSTPTEDKSAQSSETARRLTSQDDKIREAAKWLIGSFAAVGAALIAGSQLSSIGTLPVCVPSSLQCSRLWIALAGSVIALVSVVWAVWTGVALLAPVRQQVSGFRKRWKRGNAAFDYFKANPAQLQGFLDLDDMQQKEKDAYESFDKLNAEASRESSRHGLEGELRDAEEVLTDVLRRADAVVTIANHVLYVAFFRKRALRHLVMAAAFTAAAIIAFAWAANPGQTRTPTASLRGVKLDGSDLAGANLRSVTLAGASLQGADLTGADLRGTDLTRASLDSANLSHANLTGANLTDTSLEGVTWASTTCPDGTNSDEANGSCVNHLTI